MIRNKKDKIIVKPAGVCDIYEIGNWTDSYSWIKLGYKDKDYDSKYSDVAFYVTKNKDIVGYYMAYNIVNLNKDDIVPLYRKKLVLYDFAISDRAYAKLGKILINYMIEYARKNGYYAIEVKKNECKYFFGFLNRHYKVMEYGESIYLIINDLKIKLKEKHLQLYENDKVELEDLYFLYDLKFTISKTKAKLKLNNETISVNRLTGIITFPSNIKVINDKVILNSQTRNIIHLVYEMYITNQIEQTIIDYSNLKPNQFEVYVGNNAYVNRKVEFLAKNLNYVIELLDKEIEYVYPYIIEYDMNERGFSRGFSKISCDKLIDMFVSYNSKSTTLLERIEEKKAKNAFNEKLKSLERFDFWFGNPFSGIKKMTISFNGEIKVSSNCKKDNLILNKDIVIKELENFNFLTWDGKYNKNDKPVLENAWSIRLFFKDETLEFTGLDDYPNVWPYVEWFIKKYSNFTTIKEL